MADPESKIMNVSLRGWLALLLVLTVCVMSGLSMAITEPLYSMALLALGYYFGQKGKNGNV